jgi:signal transduction histidine kinase
MLGNKNFPGQSYSSDWNSNPNGMSRADGSHLGHDPAMKNGDVFLPDDNNFRPEQAEALLTISSLLISDLHPGSVLRKLMQHICGLFNANRSAVFLRKNFNDNLTSGNADVFSDEEPMAEVGPLVCAARYNLSEPYIAKVLKLYEDREYYRQQNFHSPLYIEDVQHDPRLNGLRELSKTEGVQTMLTLPLLYHQTLMGVMVLYHNQRKVYTPQELRLLSIMTNQAALAITNARLYGEARNRALEASHLAEASRLFNSSLKLRDVLDSITTSTIKLLGNAALVLIVRENTDLIYPIAFSTDAIPPDKISEPSPVKPTNAIKVGQTAIGKVVQSGTPVFLENKADILRLPLLREVEGVEGFICVPLKARSKIIGALATYNITYQQRLIPARKLEARHLELASGLADRAAIAIDNSQAYMAEKREQQAKTQFMTYISHELRTPLTTLLGYQQLINKRLSSENGPETDFNRMIEILRQFSRNMDSQLSRLNNLVQDLTSISEIDGQQLVLQKQVVDIVPLVRAKLAETENVVKNVNTARGSFSFEFRTSPNAVNAEVDVEAFERVLQSLLSNAVKFSPRGGLIKVRIQLALDEITVSIQDEGIGIPLEDQMHIFERFYKAGSSNSRASGLGLGLYISQGLMNAMGGRIEVESDEGNGSTFTIYLRGLPSQKN